MICPDCKCHNRFTHEEDGFAICRCGGEVELPETEQQSIDQKEDYTLNKGELEPTEADLVGVGSKYELGQI